MKNEIDLADMVRDGDWKHVDFKGLVDLDVEQKSVNDARLRFKCDDAGTLTAIACHE
jgi:hypothetical protein